MYETDFAAKPLRQAIRMLAATGLAIAPGYALPQDQPTGQTTLEEVVVTATRREASLQDVAIPMTAISGEALERAFAQDLRDLTNAAPNVALEPVGIFQNSAAFVIRGQG